MGWIRLKAQEIDPTTGEAKLFLDRSFALSGIEYLDHSADGATVVAHLRSGHRFKVMGPDVERLLAALGFPAPTPGS
jgi:hypothetical protein